MNKKIILIGTILFIIACLYVPVGVTIQSNTLLNQKEYVFLFNILEKPILWNILFTELLCITVATIGLSYTFADKEKDK